MKRKTQIGGAALLLATAIGISQLSNTPATRAQDQPQTGGASPKAGAPLASKDITLEQAQSVLAAAVKQSQQMKIAEDIAIVDAGGNLKAFYRMDGAWLGSVDISIKKAKTARYFDMPTGELGKMSQPGGPLYQIEVSNQGLITFPGGLPLRDSTGTIIGAIGASGSTVDNDDAVARAGAAVLK